MHEWVEAGHVVDVLFPPTGRAAQRSTGCDHRLRGIQRTDRDGLVTFDTVYPGWYEGRATHIHYQVFLDEGLVATSQIAFPDDVTAEVYRSDLYRARGENDSVPTTADDAIFADGVTGEELTLGGTVTDGYRGVLSVGIRT